MFVLKVCVDFLELMKECMIFFEKEGGRKKQIMVYICARNMFCSNAAGAR